MLVIYKNWTYGRNNRAMDKNFAKVLRDGNYPRNKNSNQ